MWVIGMKQYYYNLILIVTLSYHFRIVDKVVANFKFSGTEPLDLVKFLCKDFWEEIFQKKVCIISIFNKLSNVTNM